MMTDWAKYAQEMSTFNNAFAKRMHKKVDTLEHKLEIAIQALEEAVYFLDPTEEDMEKRAGVYRIVSTLNELKENE